MSTVTTPAVTGTWIVDPSHTDVGFSARHLVVSKVRGHFRAVDARITVPEAGPEAAEIRATIQAASVDTGNADRDAHLRSADFLDAEQFPTLEFASTGVAARGGDRYAVTGDLTIKGVTHPVTLDATFNGVAASPFGTTAIGFEATAEIDRREWGLEWNVALDTGGVLVGEKIKLTLEVEATLQDA